MYSDVIIKKYLTVWIIVRTSNWINEQQYTKYGIGDK